MKRIFTIQMGEVKVINQEPTSIWAGCWRLQSFLMIHMVWRPPEAMKANVIM